MKKYQIITTPNKNLNKPTSKVVSFDNELKDIAKDLTEVLRSNSENGIGIAANQLGYDKNIFVTEYNEEGKEIIPLKYFVNPKIVRHDTETEILDEGCLSVPNILLPVERFTKIKVKAQDLNGKTFKLTAKGLFARLIQHESEHLQGKLFTEHVREKLLKNYPDLRKLKIIFIGSGDFAEIVLRGLILMNLNIELIISEKGKPSGRDKEIRKTPVINTAIAFNKNIIETEDICQIDKDIAKLNPDLIILSDFGQIIPQSILDIPMLYAINLHPSLLPKYRGATPIQTAILNGDKETGLSIIKMSDKIDKGSVIAQNKIEIGVEDNSYSLEIKLANLALKTLLEILPDIQKNKLKLIPQDENLVVNTFKFSKENGEIDWNKSSEKIDRQIRAFFPWPGSYTFIDGKRLIVHKAHLDEKKLIIDVVQPEGKQVMIFSDFLKGYRGKKPDWFSKIKLEK
jgi:methionyl-tRNA formyltransferase